MKKLSQMCVSPVRGMVAMVLRHFISRIPKALNSGSADEITGMYMVDEEGELVTREVKGKFVNGKPEALEVLYLMRSADEWNRFMRFMERYAGDHGLGFNKS